MLAIVVVMTTSTFFRMLSVPRTPKRVPILHGKKPRFPEANSWRSQDLGNSSDYPCSMLLFAWSTHSTESSANPRGRLHCHLQLTQSKVRHGVWLAQGHTGGSQHCQSQQANLACPFGVWISVCRFGLDLFVEQSEVLQAEAATQMGSLDPWLS